MHTFIHEHNNNNNRPTCLCVCVQIINYYLTCDRWSVSRKKRRATSVRLARSNSDFFGQEEQENY